MLYLPGTSWYHESQVFNWFHTRHSLWLLAPSDRVPSQVQKLDGTQNDWGYPKAQNLPRGCLPLEESPFSVRIFKILQISECVTEGCFLISPKRPLHYCTCSHHIHHFNSFHIYLFVVCCYLFYTSESHLVVPYSSVCRPNWEPMPSWQCPCAQRLLGPRPW